MKRRLQKKYNESAERLHVPGEGTEYLSAAAVSTSTLLYEDFCLALDLGVDAQVIRSKIRSDRRSFDVSGHSAHAWMSLRDQWGLDSREAGAATRWAIDILLQHLRKKS